MQNFWQKNNLLKLENDTFIIDMMYATPENITCHPIYMEVGFGAKAYLHADAVAKLEKVAHILKNIRLKLRIRDAYRPPVAHNRILEVLPVKGLFASKAENSLHCYGTALDCCLADEHGNNLLFPTEIDAYEKKYAEQIASGKTDDFYLHFAKAASDFYALGYEEAIKNRSLLRQIMFDAGFEGIKSEWWHFQLPQSKELYSLIEWTNQ